MPVAIAWSLFIVRSMGTDCWTLLIFFKEFFHLSMDRFVDCVRAYSCLFSRHACHYLAGGLAQRCWLKQIRINQVFSYLFVGGVSIALVMWAAGYFMVGGEWKPTALADFA